LPQVRFRDLADYRAFTAAWLPLAISHLKPEAHTLIIWTNALGRAAVAAAAAAAGFPAAAGEFIWAKRSTPAAAADRSEQLLRVYETALVFQRFPPPPVPPDPAAPALAWAAVTDYRDSDDPRPTRGGGGAGAGGHPHRKPASALEPLIRNFSRPGGRINRGGSE
jgi:site-specific DNA-methyltransferase (adenine-specific)